MGQSDGQESPSCAEDPLGVKGGALPGREGRHECSLQGALSPCRPGCGGLKGPGDPHPQQVHAQAGGCQPKDIRPPRPEKPRGGEETGRVSGTPFPFLCNSPLTWGWGEPLLQGLPWPGRCCLQPRLRLRLRLFQGLPPSHTAPCLPAVNFAKTQGCHL